MSVDLKSKAPTWTIQTTDGGTAIDFDTFISMEFVDANSVAHEPIEQGAFASYNKQVAPKEIAVTLAVTKIYGEQQPVLEALDKLASGVDKLNLITPSSEYKSLNLESYSYARKDDGGAGMLIVDLKLVEIREVQVKETVAPSERVQKPPKSEGKKAKPITKAETKNPSNASTAKTGRTQPEQPRKTMLKQGMDKIRSWGKK